MSVAVLIDSLTLSDFEQIEKLAEENHGPTDIAKALNVSVRAFKHVWRDKKSQVREAYERGRLQIEIIKSEKLHNLILAENVTAIQIHEKKSQERNFEDVKADVFGF